MMVDRFRRARLVRHLCSSRAEAPQALAPKLESLGEIILVPRHKPYAASQLEGTALCSKNRAVSLEIYLAITSGGVARTSMASAATHGSRFLWISIYREHDDFFPRNMHSDRNDLIGGTDFWHCIEFE